uniref:Type 4a pilus biogenesis protein PilO n=1 Tax=Caldisericum exile TaxID=693075 RepID=A0A7C4TVM8_9BACT
MKEGTLNKSISINISTKVVVAVILFVLTATAFYFYIVRPKIEDIKMLNDKISKAEEHLNLLLYAQERLSSIKKEIDTYNERITVLKSMLPPQPDEFLFAEEFVALAKKGSGTLTGLNFEKRTGQTQSPAQMTFTLSYEAPKYEDIVLFNQLVKDNYPQIITILQFSISKAVGQNGVSKYMLNMKGAINLSQRK